MALAGIEIAPVRQLDEAARRGARDATLTRVLSWPVL